MKDEYDFSKAERGKFHRARAELVPPVAIPRSGRAIPAFSREDKARAEEAEHEAKLARPKTPPKP
jgi:hypothetical protein